MTTLASLVADATASSTGRVWSLRLARDEIHKSRVVEVDGPEPRYGQIVLTPNLTAFNRLRGTR